MIFENSIYQGHDDVDDGERQVDLDRPLQVRTLPPEVGDAGDRSADGEPGGKPDVVHQLDNVAGIQSSRNRKTFASI